MGCVKDTANLGAKAVQATGPIPDDLIPLRMEVERLATVINAPPDLLPAYDYWVEGYHVEHKYGGYHLVLVERGQQIERITVSTVDELLYHVFSTVTWNMAFESSRQSTGAVKDLRRIYFPKKVELLAMLSKDWAAKAKIEQDAILNAHPFRD